MKYFFLLFLGGLTIFFLKSQFQPVRPAVLLSGHTFQLEIADTDEKRAKGLGGRESLCQECAMLFIFDHPDRYGFWMKDMRFPIDILWIAEGKVAHIEKNISPDNQTTVYTPSVVSVDQVLEINAGLTEKYEIEKGDEVKITF